MRKVLIANRGEIALRIIRACKELNIKTILIYSEADKGSKLLSLADYSINVGPSLSTLSYLNKESILSACILHNVDGVHPGYGFLSENYYFSKLCENLNIKFIGPNAEVIKLMGDKSSARNVAIKAGVPVIPGSSSTVINPYLGLEIAKRVGFPVIIKANGGGGGKGMRLVLSKKTFFKDFYSASNEAFKAFSDGRVYIEKYIKDPRHIEVQVIGDYKGNIVHL
jgi:acetyl-CoA carboxylase biotin carboxylase subunit